MHNAGFFSPTAASVPHAQAIYFDSRETRSAEQREAELMAALPALIAHAKSQAAGWGRRLQAFDAEAVHSRKALAAIPVLRKSDLKALQEEADKLLTNPAVKKAYEHFLLVAELTK
ncbi:MAG: hypothetical protein EBW52_04300 [Betaproteobacteria bacterium]|nr:hypothetical protein [Betaproteobacteria bacterium]